MSRKKSADLSRIFRWLRERHVRRIERVTVEDQEPSHQDETILQCLQGFDVEIWEWAKMDLPADVIARSSNCVREIRLHSSGNRAVLKWWCAPGGFADRKRFPKVRL